MAHCSVNTASNKMPINNTSFINLADLASLPISFKHDSICNAVYEWVTISKYNTGLNAAKQVLDFLRTKLVQQNSAETQTSNDLVLLLLDLIDWHRVIIRHLIGTLLHRWPRIIGKCTRKSKQVTPTDTHAFSQFLLITTHKHTAILIIELFHTKPDYQKDNLWGRCNWSFFTDLIPFLYLYIQVQKRSSEQSMVIAKVLR